MLRRTFLALAALPPVADLGPFSNAQPVAIDGYRGDAMEPFLTRDNRALIFNTSNVAPAVPKLLWAERIADRRFRFRGSVVGTASEGLDAVPSVARDGTMYFISTRSYERDRTTIYAGLWRDGTVVNVHPVSSMETTERGIVTFDCEIAADGRALYYVDGDFRSGTPPRSAQVGRARRTETGFARDPSADALFATINRSGLAYAPTLSIDECEMFITVAQPRASPRIYRTTRPTLDAPFAAMTELSAATGFVEGACLSADGRRLYFHQRIDDGFRIMLLARAFRN